MPPFARYAPPRRGAGRDVFSDARGRRWGQSPLLAAERDRVSTGTGGPASCLTKPLAPAGCAVRSFWGSPAAALRGRAAPARVSRVASPWPADGRVSPLRERLLGYHDGRS